MTLRRDWQPLIQLVALCALAIAVGALIAHGDLRVLLACGAAVILAAVAVAGFRGGFAPVALAAAAALLQIPVGSVGSFQHILPAEVLIPVLLATFLARRLAHSEVDAPGRILPPRWVNGAVVVYAVMVTLNFLRSKYVIAGPIAINRPFYAFLVALGTYLVVYFGLTRERVHFEPLLKLLFWLSLAISVLGLLVAVFKLPVNLGNLTFSLATYQQSGAVRVGFLDTFGTIGLALVLAGAGWRRFRVATGLLFAAGLFASGGRSATVGMIAGALLYLLIARRWKPLYVLLLAFTLVIAFALPRLEQQSQFQRLTNISVQTLASNERGFYYHQSIHEFLQHPLLGTGMGVAENVYFNNPTEAQFQEQQLEYGGHATYHSLLKNFGLVGFVPFVVALAAAVAGLAKRARNNPAAAVFFMLLIEYAVALYSGGNGSDPAYFFLLGAGAAVIARDRLPIDAAHPRRHEGRFVT